MNLIVAFVWISNFPFLFAFSFTLCQIVSFFVLPYVKHFMTPNQKNNHLLNHPEKTIQSKFIRNHFLFHRFEYVMPFGILHLPNLIRIKWFDWFSICVRLSTSQTSVCYVKMCTKLIHNGRWWCVLIVCDSICKSVPFAFLHLILYSLVIIDLTNCVWCIPINEIDFNDSSDFN